MRKNLHLPENTVAIIISRSGTEERALKSAKGLLRDQGKNIMEHHRLDPYPIPKEKSPLYINEPWLVDKTKLEMIHGYGQREPETETDNVRVYVPLDLNKEAILRRLYRVIAYYKEANYKNESEFYVDVEMLVSQIEVYDQIWFVRHMPKEGTHSNEAIELVQEFVAMLEEIPDGGAETFPFETIDALREEYLAEKYIK